MEYRLHKLGQYVRGWTAYFGISQYYRPVPELDDWIRRRIRMCCWKQWRWVRTKIKRLVALGVSLKTAIQHAVSSKSYWHMARTPGLQQAMSNAWLRAQVRFGAVRIDPPQDKAGTAGTADAPIDLWAVHLFEEDPPEGSQPVEWMLLTNVPIEIYLLYRPGDLGAMRDEYPPGHLWPVSLESS